MDVRCPQCDTIYELDTAQVTSNSATLKCSQCQHVFRFKIPDISEENTRRWMVRSKTSGDVIYLSGLDAVHQRIMEKSIDRLDQISRTGKKWTILEEIGEFTPVFQVLESIASMMPATTPEIVEERAPNTPPPTERVMERERSSTVQQFAKTPPSPNELRETDQQYGVEISEPHVAIPPQLREDSEPTEDVTRRDRPPAPRRAVANTEPIQVGWSEASEAYSTNLKRSSGSRAWIGFLIALIIIGAGVYIIVTGDLFKREPNVISLGGDTQLGPIIKPARQSLFAALDAGAQTAQSDFEATWNGHFAAVQTPLHDAVATADAESLKEAEEGVDSLLKKAQSALERSKIKQARLAYMKVLKKEPSNSEAITGLGWAHLEEGDSSTAASEFRRALKLNPSYGDAYIGLGLANRQLGKYQAAYDAYDQYLGRHPRGSKASIAKYQMEELQKLLESN